MSLPQLGRVAEQTQSHLQSRGCPVLSCWVLVVDMRWGHRCVGSSSRSLQLLTGPGSLDAERTVRVTSQLPTQGLQWKEQGGDTGQKVTGGGVDTGC